MLFFPITTTSTIQVNFMLMSDYLAHTVELEMRTEPSITIIIISTDEALILRP